jgi:lipopolysaccharide transport system ATP-binding protein
MSDIAIRVECLSKQYTIGTLQHRPNTLRDHLVGTIQRLLQRVHRQVLPPATIWALKDVSFEVKQGEVLGIIGRNGAGKSTLLKILSRITEPTLGQAEIYGRIASLLEVGTGFHSELTGRENVYLNGAVLGMSRAEITRKFDEIVAFSGVEKYIDTPVKRYSSGMKVRLAFAVAAYLEPEILIIDEVLAVGDAAFQRKCLGKIGEVACSGRTVLFVSHNVGAVTNLCSSAMWLDYGEVRAYGDVDTITNAYLSSDPASSAGTTQWHRNGTGEARFIDVRLKDLEGNQREAFMMGENIVVEFALECYRNCPSLSFALEIKRAETDLQVLHLVNEDCGFSVENLDVGIHGIRVEIPNCLLYPSSYTLALWMGITNASTFDFVHNVLSFEIYQGNISMRTFPFTGYRGVFYQHSVWEKSNSYTEFYREII